MSEDWAVAGVFSSELEAHLAASALEAGGVESRIVTDDVGGMYPGIQVVRGVRLLVRAAVVEEARALLAARFDEL